MVSLVDLMPTLLSAAGIDPPGPVAGRDVGGYLDGTTDPREELFVQVSESGVGRAIRTDEWKLSAVAPNKDGKRHPGSDTYRTKHLYDLRDDPHEQTNLAGRDSTREVETRLRKRLAEWIATVEGRDATVKPARSRSDGTGGRPRS